MATTVTVTGSISYADAYSADELIPTDFVATLSGTTWTHLKQSIATTETAINLGALSSLGYALFVNRDPTNYIDLKVATSGAIFARLAAAGGFAILKLGSGAQVPYAIANTGACQMEIFITPT